jgi:hypothetical protein
MTEAVKGVLEAFNALTDAEKREAAVEVLRRSMLLESGELSDAALVAAADELFLELDAAESEHGKP